MFKRLLNIFILIFCATVMMAQSDGASEAATDTIKISFTKAKKTTRRQVLYSLYKTPTKASSYLQPLQEAAKKLDATNPNYDMNAWTDVTTKLKLHFRTSKANGEFTVRAYPGMAVLVSTYNPNVDFSEDDAQFFVIPLEAGKTVYTKVVGEAVGNGYEHLDEVVKEAKNKDTVSIKALPPIDDGKNIIIPINFRLPAGYASEYARLVIQPYAIDCQTEDTVDYIPGLVYEGLEYHKLQNKRMMFNFAKYDKVAPMFVAQPLWSDEPVAINTQIVYRKPVPAKTYKAPYRVAIADFNHIYFTQEAATTSCNSKNFFKFLDLGVAAADMDVREYEVAGESVFGNEDRDLRLNFIVGKSDLNMNDSLTQVQIKQLADELRSYGDKLMQVRVGATASPDGGLEKNKQLAQERTRVAANTVKRLLGKADITFETAPAKVCTWNDVAEQLKADGHPEIAEQIIANMGPGGYGGDAAISQIPGYQEYVLPTLDKLRVMHVSYRYEREHVMDEAECKEAYARRKPDLLKGKGPDFSDGDYYKLFVALKDPAEQDTLTMLAYRHMLKTEGYDQIKFSQYVANRMAMLNQRLGKPDPRVLSPFINYRLRAKTDYDRSDRPQKNRREVLINQIICWFQAEERDSALLYCDYWFGNDKDPKVERLKKYITFKEGFIKMATNQLSPEEDKKVRDAMKFVFQCAPDNEAVIRTEARDLLNTPYQLCDSLLRKINDADPKKWYLRAMLESDKEAKSLGEKKPKDYIPDYMCYFNHSFELDPSYKWIYFNEGQISDDLRARFKWSKKKKDLYDAKFNELVTVKDKPKAEESEDSDAIQLSGEDDVDETQTAAPAETAAPAPAETAAPVPAEPAAPAKAVKTKTSSKSKGKSRRRK